jgi:hypothetical protein
MTRPHAIRNLMPAAALGEQDKATRGYPSPATAEDVGRSVMRQSYWGAGGISRE